MKQGNPAVTILVSVLATIGALCLLGWFTMFSCTNLVASSMEKASTETNAAKEAKLNRPSATSPGPSQPAAAEPRRGSDLPEVDAYRGDDGRYTFYIDYGKVIGWSQMEGDYITGEVRNDSNRTIELISLTFDLYDGKKKVGSAHDFLNSLGKGETWKFKCYTFGQGATAYRVAGLTYSKW